MTAYRQQALACAAALSAGPRRPRDVKTAVPDAPKILLRNVYGWFVRVERGLYDLTDLGRAALMPPIRLRALPLIRDAGHASVPT